MDPYAPDRQARQMGHALADSLKTFIDKKLDEQAPAKGDDKKDDGKTAKINLKAAKPAGLAQSHQNGMKNLLDEAKQSGKPCNKAGRY